MKGQHNIQDILTCFYLKLWLC